MNAADTTIDVWDIKIRYVPLRRLYVGALRTPQATFVVTGPTEQLCTERLLERFGCEASERKWGAK